MKKRGGSMNYQVILIDDNQSNNVLNEALIRNWNNDIDISIIDNSEEVLNYFTREYKGVESVKTKTAVFLDEFMPYLEGMCMMEYVEKMHIEETEGVEVYFLSNKTNELMLMKAGMMTRVKKVLPKPLTVECIAEILAA
jgi:response regulator of citrate/malate metabolism